MGSSIFLWASRPKVIILWLFNFTRIDIRSAGSTDICQGPVELAKVKELRICWGCYEQIVNAITGKGE